eukprot:CAMPEP_0179369468 /NCGR_PEP_ID=MMETSP0797-20121207/84632_1 /TAXON_ID=47934 /ORGANISM="Dinophysis acuminata, Strain DAEP01" /LENGTH=124 /DNA_ID=CAMNT_0021085103 /DNA_START=78 /DNA_END=455 /DNA_ORIENTATION=-
MMEAARRRLEGAGYSVAFGILAPVDAGHIRGKGAEPLPLETRVSTVCVARPGSDMVAESSAGPLYCVREEVGEFSSTAVRAALENGDGATILRLCGAPVARELGIEIAGGPHEESATPPCAPWC